MGKEEKRGEGCEAWKLNETDSKDRERGRETSGWKGRGGEKGMDWLIQAKKRKVSVVYGGRQEDQKRKWRKPSKGASGRQRTSVERNLCFPGPQLQPCISSENPSPSLYFLWTPAG